MEELKWGGAYTQRKISITHLIGLAYSQKEVYVLLYCFHFVLCYICGQFPSVISPDGLIFRRTFFCVASLRGLYLEGLIFQN